MGCGGVSDPAVGTTGELMEKFSTLVAVGRAANIAIDMFGVFCLWRDSARLLFLFIFLEIVSLFFLAAVELTPLILIRLIMLLLAVQLRANMLMIHGLEEDATLERRMIGAFPFPGLEGPNGHDESHDEDEAEESSSSSSSTGSSMSSLDRPRTVLLANPGPHPLPLMVTVSSSSVLSGDGGGPSSAQQPSQEPVVSSSRPLSSIPAEEDAEDQRSRSQLLGQIPRSDAAV